MKSCLISDDHAILREAMVATIGKSWPDAVVREAADYPSAWEAASSSSFDLCISDLVMPGSEPVDGIARLRSLQPDMPIIILTGSHDDAVMMQLLAMGVDGFVPKSSSGPVIKAAIELVLAGGKYLPPRMIEMAGNEGTASKAQPTVRLTRQQQKVLSGLFAGQSNKEIALDLGVAPSTIKFHVDSLFDRLDARNRVDAIGKAQALGLI